MSRATLTGVYNNAPPEALDYLAEYYEQVAAETRSAAARRRADAARNASARRGMNERGAATRYAVELLAAHLQSVDYQTALDRAVAVSGIDAYTVEYHWRTAMKNRDAIERFKRDRRIMQLARAGWTDAEIGTETGLSARQVNRVINSKKHHLNRRPMPDAAD